MMQNQWKFSNFAPNKDCNYEKVYASNNDFTHNELAFPKL